MCGYTLPMKKCGNSLRRDHPQNVYYPKYQTLRRFDDDTPIDPQNLHPISLAFLQKKKLSKSVEHVVTSICILSIIVGWRTLH